MNTRPRYRLTIEAMPDEWPAEYRLKRLLKVMLRSFKFRLVEAVEPVEQGERKPGHEPVRH